MRKQSGAREEEETGKRRGLGESPDQHIVRAMADHHYTPSPSSSTMISNEEGNSRQGTSASGNSKEERHFHLARYEISKPKSRLVEQMYPLPISMTISSSSRYVSSDETNKGEESKIFGICDFFERLIQVVGLLFLFFLLYNLGEQRIIWGLEIWKWGVMVIMVCCGRLINNWLVLTIIYLAENNFLFKKEVLCFFLGSIGNFELCIRLGLVLTTRCLIFQGVEHSSNAMKILNFTYGLIISLFVGSVIWLVKTIIMKLLSPFFYANTFFDRIRESIFNQCVLQELSGHPMMEMRQNAEFQKRSRWLTFVQMSEKMDEWEFSIDVSKLHTFKREKITPWTMMRMVKAIRDSGSLTFYNVIDNTTNKKSVGDLMNIVSEMGAEREAQRIFKNVAKSGERYIETEDLLRFLTKREVINVLPQFAGTLDSGKIEESAFIEWVMKVYLDRKFLVLSLKDMKIALKQLRKLVSGIVLAFIFMISPHLIGLATTMTYFFIFSLLILFLFFFGNTWKTTFESIMFVFIRHPFDVGDRCEIDGVEMRVEEMNILTTVFLTANNQKICHSNAMLAAKPIKNFFRSPDMTDSVLFSIDSSVSKDIDPLIDRIASYVDSKPHHWRSEFWLVIRSIDNENMNMTLYVNHTMNLQNMLQRKMRIYCLITELHTIFKDLSTRSIVQNPDT